MPQVETFNAHVDVKGTYSEVYDALSEFVAYVVGRKCEVMDLKFDMSVKGKGSRQLGNFKGKFQPSEIGTKVSNAIRAYAAAEPNSVFDVSLRIRGTRSGTLGEWFRR
jgi:hypothetical protein